MTPLDDAPPPADDPNPRWGQSLATGAAGIALLHIELARTTDRPADAHPWLAAMTRTAPPAWRALSNSLGLLSATRTGSISPKPLWPDVSPTRINSAR